MEYTVQKLARMAGVSPRTLRFYDEIDLLKPARCSSSGYRIYGQAEVDRLQQILFYRALGVELSEISAIITDPEFSPLASLRSHHQRLLARREQLDQLIQNVELSIAEKEGKITMKDQEKFAGFVAKLIDENEAKYGEEVRSRYGAATVENSNKAFRNMSKETYDKMTKLGESIHELLEEAVPTGDPGSEAAQTIARLHKEWLTMAWGGAYDPEAHANLAKMYVDDERFRAHYDQKGPGRAEFLRDAILLMTKS